MKKEKLKKEASRFTGMSSRKERREEARKNKTEFEPQYNGELPVRTKTKAEVKIIKNDMRRLEKSAN